MKHITAATLICLITVALTVTTAEAKVPRNGRYTDAAGHIYIMSHGKPKTGYFRYHGAWYYGHKTSTAKYPRGSVTTGEMRIRSDNRWFAYGSDGKRINKDQYVRKSRTRKILQLDIRSRDHSVRYVYQTATTRRGYRYNTQRKRWQQMDDSGKWVDYGHQVIPLGWVDSQK